MAILDSIVPFKGRLGKVISYQRNGKHCLRSVPEFVRQTDNTRRAAKYFGTVSRKGAFIRKALEPDLDIFSDQFLVIRLNSYIMKAGRNNHAGLKNFRFNGYTGADNFFTVPTRFTNDGKLHIPAQKFNVFEGAVLMEVKLIATRTDFTTRTVIGTDAEMVNIDLEQPFHGADLNVAVPGKGTLLITLQIRTANKEGFLNNRKYNAADIIAVVEDRPKKLNPPKTYPLTAQSQPKPVRYVRTVQPYSGQEKVPRE